MTCDSLNEKCRIVFIISILTTALPRLVFSEEPVQFTDPNLQIVVENTLGILQPTPTDMLELISLDAKGTNITNLIGIEYAMNLTRLNLIDNEIQDISVLGHLRNLRDLLLPQNQISDISGLSNLTNLETIWLGRNQIKEITVLGGLINLKQLLLFQNQINDISALSNLMNLETLSL